ncbi:AMP-binding protein [Nonomuraea ferruginea]
MPEFEPVIGMFVNTLVLRTDLSGDPSFDELLDRVRGTVLEALDHADVPFDRLVEALRLARDPSRTPLYQVGFNLLPMDTRGQFPNGTAQHDLGLDVVRTPSGAGLYFEYSTELYDADTVARMAEAYRLVLEAAVADPGIRVSRLPLMTPERERQLLTGWNATAAPYPAGTLHELVAEQAARTPDEVALRDLAGGTLTYAELDERVRALAGRLAAAGVGAETCVALCLPRDAELVVALLAVLRAGGHYLPLDPAYPAERLSYILADSGARLLITTSRLVGDLPADRPPVFLLDRPPEGPPATPVRVGPDNLAYLIYTSGSTGRPKGVEVPHRGGRQPGHRRDPPGRRRQRAAHDVAVLRHRRAGDLHAAAVRRHPRRRPGRHLPRAPSGRSRGRRGGPGAAHPLGGSAWSPGTCRRACRGSSSAASPCRPTWRRGC